MIRRTRIPIIVFAAGWLIGGCNLGMQPTGPSVQEINAIRAKWPPEKQIEGINQSPMPGPEKKRRISEIRAKYHMPAEEAPSEQAQPWQTP